MSQPTRRVESKHSCNMILHTLKMTTTRDMNRAQRAVRLEVTDVGLHRWSYALSFQRALEGGVRHQNATQFNTATIVTRLTRYWKTCAADLLAFMYASPARTLDGRTATTGVPFARALLKTWKA